MKQNINLSRSELKECRHLFNKHYTLGNGNKMNDTITINWLELKDIIQNNSGIPHEDEIILRFIHRLTENNWFLTMECCHVNSIGMIDFVGNRYDIKDFSIIKSDFKGYNDSSYKRLVNYNGESLEKLVSVKSVMFPWEQEFVSAARVNKVDRDDSVHLTIASVSYEYGESSSLVNYPHLLAMFFSSNLNGDMVDDNPTQSEGLIKPRKAFNMNSPCPPSCDIYEFYDLFFCNYETPLPRRRKYAGQDCVIAV